jgi:hypothetical protein
VKLLELNTKKVFYDRLTFYYAELPKFSKTEDQLVTREDKWLYVLVNLKKLNEIPLSLQDDPIFKQFFMDAKTAHLTELELQAYYNSKKAEWDEYAVKTTAIQDATVSIIKKILQESNLSIEEIAKFTRVDLNFVVKIKNALNSSPHNGSKK